MIKFNPHKRLEKINEELYLLEKEEKQFMMKKYKSKPKRYIDVESSIFFLAIEKMQIEKTINFFKVEFDKIAKKYPEHYWRWQFYAKILNPDKKQEARHSSQA